MWESLQVKSVLQNAYEEMSSVIDKLLYSRCCRCWNWNTLQNVQRWKCVVLCRVLLPDGPKVPPLRPRRGSAHLPLWLPVSALWQDIQTFKSFKMAEKKRTCLTDKEKLRIIENSRQPGIVEKNCWKIKALNCGLPLISRQFCPDENIHYWGVPVYS